VEYLTIFPFPIEYIQATGRGGRDGKACHCVLFYSPNDIGFVESVLQFQKIEKHQRKRLEVLLENVCKVCS
jgi:superfamily II DNA helicase RecQ